jgi:hypothetical protein
MSYILFTSVGNHWHDIVVKFFNHHHSNGLWADISLLKMMLFADLFYFFAGFLFAILGQVR